MKTSHVLSVISFLWCVTLLWGCDNTQNTSNGETVEEQHVTEVRVADATTGRIVNQISATGTVVAFRKTGIRPKVSGRIEAFFVSEGEQVEKDQVLAHLEQQDFLLAKHQAEAALGTAKATLQQLLAGARAEDIQGAKAALSQARASLEEAKSEFERIKRLYETHVVSSQMYDAANARYKISRQAVTIASETLKKATSGPTEEDIQVARARVREAEVGLEIAEQQLNDSTIRAPFSGVIAEKFLNEGEIVSSVSASAIFRLVEMNTVKIECAIPESEMSRVSSGSETHIEVDAYPGEQFSGRISTISPVVDPASHTFKVTITIPNTDHRLKPGMFARVNLITDIHDNAVLIPRSALTIIKGKDTVFIIQDSTAILRHVTIGLKTEHTVEILQGITPGDSVIIEGNYGLEDGGKIKYQNQ